MKKKFTFLMAALMLLTMMVLPGKTWAETSTVTASKVTSSSASWTGTASETWSVSVTGGALNQSVTNGYAQIGTGSSPSTSITFTTSGLSGTISSIVVNCASKSGSAKANVTVGGSAFGKQNQSTPSWSSNNGGNVTFTGSATGTIVVTLSGSSGATYIKTITVTYTTAASYTITAISNNENWGTVSGTTTITASPKSGYRVMAGTDGYTVTVGTATVTNNGNNTFSVTATSNCTVRINFEAIPTHTVTFSVNGFTSTQDFAEGAAITFPANPANIENKTFVGWVTTAINGATNIAPDFVDTTSETMGNNDVTYYAVYALADASGEPVETKTQTLQYDTWTYFGDTDDKGTYRLFGDDSYIVSAAFDLSKLSKVIVYGGTYGGSSYKSLTIGDGNYVWNNVTVSGSSQTGVNTYTNGTALSGTKQLRITSKSGDGSSYGVRISKVEIYTMEPSIVYSNYCTTVVATPTFSHASGIYTTEQNVTIACVTSGATIFYTIDGTEPTNESTEYDNSEINIATTTTIKAIAYVSTNASAVATATYTITPYYVIYNSNGVENIVNQASSVFSLDAPSNAPTGFTFVGWTMYETELDVNDILEGATINLTDHDTDNASLYAVFSGEVGAIPAIPATPARFEKVTESLVNWSGTYLIVHEGNNTNPQPKALDGSLENLDATPNTINVTISSGTITANDDLIDAMFTIAQNSQVDNYPYTIKSASGYYIGNTSENNGFNQSETDKYGNAIAYNSSKIEITGSGTTKLQFNQNADNSKFRYYKSSQNAIQLYKYVEGTPGVPAVAGTTARFIRVFQDETATGNVSILGPSIIPSGKYLNMGTNTLSNTTAVNLIIDNGGQLICSNSVAATVHKAINAWNTGNKTGWYLLASPITSATISGESPTISNLITTSGYDLFRYNESDNYWQVYKEPNPVFTSFENGRGYLYRNEDDQDMTFAGNTNTSVTYNLSYAHADGDLKGFNIIGNPFTHDITWSDITKSNVNTVGYYTLGTDGNWTIHNSSGDLNTNKISPMQGFLVQATGADPSVTFGAAGKNNETKANNDYIKLSVSNSQYNDVTYALFDKGDGINKIDHRNAEIPMLYISQDGKNYAIATMGDDTQMFDLSIEAKTMGKYTISMNAKGNFSYIHLIDRLTGDDTNLLIEDYSFIGSPQDNAERFIVKLSYDNGSSSGSETFAYQSGNEIIVNGEGTLEVYDVTGRKVMATTINGVETINGLSSGVYIFRVIGETLKTQKIVVR